MTHPRHVLFRPGVLAGVICCLQSLPLLAEELPPAVRDEAPAAADTTAREHALEQRLRDLEAQFKALSAQIEAESIERMIQDARVEARMVQEAPRPEQREFREGGLALQMLNPEISFFADMLLGLVIDGTQFYAGSDDRSGMPVREVGLLIQHALDPYSLFKSAINFIPEFGAERLELEEVYISWFGLIPSVSLTLGRFRQNFGVLNRWHAHDLDQTQYPMALEQVLGEGGLSGNGFAVRWLMPALWAHANELTLEVVDGTNETLFSGQYFSIPSSMLHLKSYYDLSETTYLELGLTGMFGFNNARGLLSEDETLIDEPWRKTFVAGANLTLDWTPPEQAAYRSLVWRTEFYYVSKELPPGELRSVQRAWGLYSYLQYQLSQRSFIGLRSDVALPTVRERNALAWDVVPYLTFWQSEFVYMRLEYQHGQNIPYLTPAEALDRRTDNRLLFQVNFAAGPHKHEKY